MQTHFGRWNKECRQREQRQLCHNSFWCGEDRAHAINLSPGGMCVRLSRRAEPGEIVTLHQGPTLQVKARIAWTRRLENCTEIGVQFTDEAANIKAWLKSLDADPSQAEPILALPAPGQTFNPAMLQLNNGSTGARPVKIGKSWTAAMRLSGNNNT